MKQKLKRFMAGFMAMLTLVGTLFTNGTTAFAASPQANIAFWNASVKNSGEVSELKPGYNHGKILYSILDGNSAYCMNFGLRADGGQLMNSYDDASTSMSAQQRKGMIREKGEFMLGLCEQCIGDSLNSRQKSIIDRCVRKLYIDIARSKEKYIPVMSDFYDILMAQPEDEAKDIALSLELFVNGSLNIFNHQTNVDVDNRFTVYGIRDLGTELSPITMLVMMESIQNRIVENGKRGKATWLYIDEFHVLLNSEYSAKYLQQLWKKVRKQGGLCTGITQNVVDLLQNYTATTMLANSEFVALLKQANTDSSKMAEVIGVSEAQLRFVTNTASGMGLIKCGSVVIPFDNQISKDTDLYRLYNTNIHEKIAEQKKKEAMLQ